MYSTMGGTERNMDLKSPNTCKRSVLYRIVLYRIVFELMRL